MINGRWTAFIQGSFNQWPLKVLYSIAVSTSKIAVRVRHLAQRHLDTVVYILITIVFKYNVRSFCTHSVS